MSIEILEILLYIPSIIFVIIIAACPFIINKKITKKYRSKILKIFHSTIVCLFIAGIIGFIFTFWATEFSTSILLSKMGYNKTGMNEVEYYQNVKPELLQKAKELKESQMGIGWPLKAIFIFVIFIIPYELLMNIILGIRKNKDFS